MKLRHWSRFAAVGLAAAAVALTACAPSSNSEGDNSTDTEKLTVWSWRTEDVAAYNKIFDVYEKKHPGLTIEFKAFKNTEYNQILTTGLTGDGGPDVAQVRAYGQLQPFVEGGNLLALDDKIDGLKDFSDDVIAGSRGKKDNKIYGVPFSRQTLQVYYNKKIFSDNNISVPKSWDDFINAAKTLQSKKVTPFAVGGKDAWTLPLLHDIIGASRYGGTEFEQAVLTGKTDFTNPDDIASIELINQLKPYMPQSVVGVSYTDSQVLFSSEKAAMFMGGSFELGFFQRQNPNLDMGVFDVPPAPGAKAQGALTPGYLDGSFAVPQRTKNQKAALELASWMATKEFGQLFADELKQMSTVDGVKYSDPLLQEMADNYAAKPTPYLMLVDFRYGQPLGSDLLGKGVQQLLLGERTATQVGQDIQNGISQWFTPQK